MPNAVLWERWGGARRGDCQLTEEPIASRDNGRRRRLWWERKSSPGVSLCSWRGRGPPQHHGDHRQHAARAGESSGPEPGWGSGSWGRTPPSLAGPLSGCSAVPGLRGSYLWVPIRRSDSRPSGLSGGGRQNLMVPPLPTSPEAPGPLYGEGS